MLSRSLILLSIFSAFALFSSGANAVVLSEIMFNPEGDEDLDEFIELYNESTVGVSISSWTISDGEGVDTLLNAGMGLVAGPKQYILILDPDYIEEGSTTYDQLVPENALVVTINNSTFGSRGLSNSAGETVSIMNAAGQTIAAFTYDIDIPDGHSDEKILMNGGDNSDNWSASLSIHGTPGGRNSVTPPDRDLAITDFHADPAHPNQNESFDILITVKNQGLMPVADSLFLLELEDQNNSDGTIIESWLTPVLSSGDSVVFLKSLEMSGASARFYRAILATDDDNSGNNSFSIAVGANVTTGTVLINEIMYQPLAGRSEWVEFVNTGSSSVLLTDWQFSDGSALEDTALRVNFPAIAMDANSFLILAADSSIFIEAIPDSVPVVVWNSSPPSLNNNGDSLFLFNAQSETVDRVDYEPGWGNETAGYSLERVSVLSESNDPLNWAFSLSATGATPGQTNSRALPAEESLLVLEPNPFSPDGDGNDDLLAIRYHLEHADSRLDIRIFDVRGREVRFLCNNVAAGFTGEILWDGKGDAGRDLPTGLYVVYIEASGQGGDRIQSGRRVVALARPS
jgi:hypothetical protein